METLVLYHSPCWDGAVAAWAAKRGLGSNGVEILGAPYGRMSQNLREAVRGRRVLCLDWTPHADDIEPLLDQASAVEVYDHHKTGIRRLEPYLDRLDGVVLDRNRSGGQIAWDVFHGGPRPAIVDIAADYDLWTWQRDDTYEVMAYLQELGAGYIGDWSPSPLQIEAVRERVEDSDWVHDKAKLHARARRSRICRTAKQRVHWAWLGGHLVRAAVCAPGDESEVGEQLAEGRAFGVTWSVSARGDTVKLSLRSREPHGIDVSELAEQWGGGGHPGSAGCRIPLADWWERLQAGRDAALHHGELDR